MSFFLSDIAGQRLDASAGEFIYSVRNGTNTMAHKSSKLEHKKNMRAQQKLTLLARRGDNKNTL